MSMSQHAKMQDLLTPFRDHYHNRDRAGRKANAQGMRVMGRTSFENPHGLGPFFVGEYEPVTNFDVAQLRIGLAVDRNGAVVGQMKFLRVEG